MAQRIGVISSDGLCIFFSYKFYIGLYNVLQVGLKLSSFKSFSFHFIMIFLSVITDCTNHYNHYSIR